MLTTYETSLVLCAVVCFESAELLDAVIKTTPVLKGVHFCWSYFGSAVCTKYGKLGHTSLGCVTNKKSFSSGLPRQVLSHVDKSRLAAIYAKHSAPVAYPIIIGSSFPPLLVCNVLLNNGSSLEMKSIPQVSSVLDNRFAALEHSLASLAEHVDKLAKRLDTPGSMNQEMDIVMSESLGVATNGGTVVRAAVFDSLIVSRMEEMLKNFSVMVMSLSAKMDNASLVPILHLSQ
ncbi:hypothetical protein G9A89_006544 [Geosiphon pyriformis]|nr:hypothetical protein G9A89_006544 [Geosiphon pyriformis]